MNAPRTHRSRALSAAVVGLAVALATVPVLSPPTAAAQELSEARRVRIARRLARSTVSVLAGMATGSGFVIGDERWIVTNHHVVAGTHGGGLQVRFGSGTTLPARILEDDATHDLALLEVVGTVSAPPLELADSDDVEVGQAVLAFGSPFGLDGTLTEGIVSARRDRSDVGGGEARRLIQTDAPINPGNSGGPLVDARGRVIGVNTAIVSESGSSAGIGFAVPANYVRDLVERVRRHIAGEPDPEVDAAVALTGAGSGSIDAVVPVGPALPVFLGVHGVDFSGTTSGGDPVHGVRVERVDAGSPAQRGGIVGASEPAPALIARLHVPWTGHIITAVDGNAIASVAELDTYLGTLAPGAIIRLSVTVGPGLLSGDTTATLEAPR